MAQSFQQIQLANASQHATNAAALKAQIITDLKCALAALEQNKTYRADLVLAMQSCHEIEATLDTLAVEIDREHKARMAVQLS